MAIEANTVQRLAAVLLSGSTSRLFVIIIIIIKKSSTTPSTNTRLLHLLEYHYENLPAKTKE